MPITPTCQPSLSISSAAGMPCRSGPVGGLDALHRLVEHGALDGAALGVELVEPQRQRLHLVRIIARQQARAEIGLATRPPALTRGPSM